MLVYTLWHELSGTSFTGLLRARMTGLLTKHESIVQHDGKLYSLSREQLSRELLAAPTVNRVKALKQEIWHPQRNRDRQRDQSARLGEAEGCRCDAPWCECEGYEDPVAAGHVP